MKCFLRVVSSLLILVLLQVFRVGVICLYKLCNILLLVCQVVGGDLLFRQCFIQCNVSNFRCLWVFLRVCQGFLFCFFRQVGCVFCQVLFMLQVSGLKFRLRLFVRFFSNLVLVFLLLLCGICSSVSRVFRCNCLFGDLLNICRLLWICDFFRLQRQVFSCGSQLFGLLLSCKLILWLRWLLCRRMRILLCNCLVWCGLSSEVLQNLLVRCFRLCSGLQFLVWVSGGIRWLMIIVWVWCLVWVFFFGLLMMNGQMFGSGLSNVFGQYLVDRLIFLFGSYFRLLCLLMCSRVLVWQVWCSQKQNVRQLCGGIRLGLWQIVVGLS